MCKKHIVNFSGGKDSTAMLILMLENKYKIDDIVYFNTGWEFPQMEDHIKKVEKYTGLNITKLNPEKSFDYWMFDHVKTKGSRKGEKGYGWCAMSRRWCMRLKIERIEKYVKEKHGDNIINYIGIALDEPKRIKNQKYPLVDNKMTEEDALIYCYERGFHWDGLYQHFDRVSCFCCPLQGKKGYRILFNKYPNLFKKMFNMDKKTKYKLPCGKKMDFYKRMFEFENELLKGKLRLY